MSVIIEGYNYDIFISYRQKDNKHDGWVTEFVENLKGELESTFKEEIYVYFDINPNDGLLETHDVDESLKDKLRCLVFIPIISRTYCDPHSFAWEHEFKAFLELASRDQFGLKVKLPNGNVASRVLPVRIHDLDPGDEKLCESVLGGALRGIEFIYREPGVNRPLTPGDDEKSNISKTRYRNQINKLAIAIKEIFSGLKTETVPSAADDSLRTVSPQEDHTELAKPCREKVPLSGKHKIFYGILLLVLLTLTAVLVLPKIFRRDRLASLRSSGERIAVAVMPFQNLTSDTVWNVWQEGIQDILISSLSNSQELKVRQAESVKSLVRGQGIVNFASITPSVGSTISQKLEADVLIMGSIKQAGTISRLYAQIIDPETEEVFRSFQIEGLYREENIFLLIDSLSVMVKDFIIMSELEKSTPSYYRSLVSTRSPEAYRYFVHGRNEYSKQDFLSAISWFSKAIDIDSNFYQPIIMTSLAYSNQYEQDYWLSTIYDKLYLLELAKKWCLMAYEKSDKMPIHQKINTNWVYAHAFGTPNDRIKYLKQLIELDDQMATAYFNVGGCYFDLQQYEKAIPEYEKALEIYDKWDITPFWVLNYNYLGKAYQKGGQYKEAEKVYKKAEQYFPDDIELAGWHGILCGLMGDTIAALKYWDKLVTLSRRIPLSEATIATLRGFGFNEAGMPDRAEAFYREALSLEPGNPDRINNLAYFLIDRERNTDEGMRLVDVALELCPGHFNFLHTKGWGLYKMGRYDEALRVLQESWDLRREKAFYEHLPFLHLEAAKRAVSGVAVPDQSD